MGAGFIFTWVDKRLIAIVLIAEPILYRASQFRVLTTDQQAVESINPVDVIDFAGEKVEVADLIQRCFTDDGRGSGRVTSLGYDFIRNYQFLVSEGITAEDHRGFWMDSWRAVAVPVATFRFPSRKQLETDFSEMLNDVESALRKPSDQMINRSYQQALREKWEKSPLISWQLEIYLSVIQNVLQATTEQQATTTAIAIHRFKSRTGGRPEQLEELLDKEISALPTDPFTGQPLQYQITDSGFVLYSLGPDLLDNGGQRKLVFANPFLRNESDMHPEPTGDFVFIARATEYQGYDWVLWPRLLRQLR